MAAFIAAALCVPMMLSAAALDIERSESYTISQSTDSAGRVIRSVEREINSDRLMSADETREMLRSLGMPEQAIEGMDEKDLARYAASPKIYTSDAYIRTDSLGRMTYVTELEAVMGAAEQKNELYPLAIFSDNRFDSYMKLHFTAAALGDERGTYIFEVNALWLTMPCFRWKDGVGIAVQGMAIDYSTIMGYYQYRQERYSGGALQSTLLPEHTKTTLSRYDFRMAADSDVGFYGAGTLINLPDDTGAPVDGMEIFCTDYFVHTEFEASVRYPTIETHFGAVGSYVHRTTMVIGGLSVSVAAADGEAGLVLRPGAGCRERHAQLLSHHAPQKEGF